MLCIFTPFNFTRNQQLIRIKCEDLISSMPTIGSVFFLARACQHKTSKIGIIILSLSQLKLYILQDCKTFKKNLSSYILFTQKNTRNSAFHIFIKYYTSLGIQHNLVHQNWTLLAPDMVFQSQHKIWKRNKQNPKLQSLTHGTHGSAGPPVKQTETGERV